MIKSARLIAAMVAVPAIFAEALVLPVTAHAGTDVVCQLRQDYCTRPIKPGRTPQGVKPAGGRLDDTKSGFRGQSRSATGAAAINTRPSASRQIR